MGCFSCFGPGSTTKSNQVAPGDAAVQHCTTAPRVREDALSASLSKAVSGGEALAFAQDTSKLEVFTWTHKLDSDRLRMRVEALNEAVDALMGPLLDKVDGTMAEANDEDSMSEVNWETATTKHITSIMQGAAAEGGGGGLPVTASAVSKYLSIIHALWKACGDQAFDVPEPSFHSASANRLMGMLAVVFCRRVVLESAATLQRNQADMQAACDAVGLTSDHVAASLSPASKALMVYMGAGAQQGMEKVVVTVRRGMAFNDTWREAQNKGFVRRSGGAQCCMIFPLFYDESTWEGSAVAGASQSGASTSGRGGGEGAAGASTGGRHRRDAVVEQGEGHGPRKEFFTLVGKSLGEAEGNLRALFTFNRSGGHFWFNQVLAQTPELEGRYEVAGWLLAQAVCNRATLGVDLPTVLFQKILQGEGFSPTMATLQQFDPDAASAIRNVARLSDSEFRAMLEMEDRPKDMGRNEYTTVSIRDLLVNNVGWQFDALRAGFFRVLDPDTARGWLVSPSDLREMVCGAGSAAGGADFHVRDVFRVVLDDELASCVPLLDGLWGVVDAWAPEVKRQFVHFVTGSDRLPLPGTELLRVEMPFMAMSTQDHRRHLGMLPQAHTCENVLELPNYWDALVAVRAADGGEGAGGGGEESPEMRAELRRVIDERFRLAVTQCDVYGLDEVAAADDAIPPPPPATRSRPPPSPVPPSDLPGPSGRGGGGGGGGAGGGAAYGGAGAAGAAGGGSQPPWHRQVSMGSNRSLGSEWSGRSSPDDVAAIHVAPPPPWDAGGGGGGAQQQPPPWAPGGGGDSIGPLSPGTYYGASSSPHIASGGGGGGGGAAAEAGGGGGGGGSSGVLPPGAIASPGALPPLAHRGSERAPPPGSLPALRDPTGTGDRASNRRLQPLTGLVVEASVDSLADAIEAFSLSPEASQRSLGGPGPSPLRPPQPGPGERRSSGAGQPGGGGGGPASHFTASSSFNSSMAQRMAQGVGGGGHHHHPAPPGRLGEDDSEFGRFGGEAPVPGGVGGGGGGGVGGSAGADVHRRSRGMPSLDDMIKELDME